MVIWLFCCNEIGDFHITPGSLIHVLSFNTNSRMTASLSPSTILLTFKKNINRLRHHRVTVKPFYTFQTEMHISFSKLFFNLNSRLVFFKKRNNFKIHLYCVRLNNHIKVSLNYVQALDVWCVLCKYTHEIKYTIFLWVFFSFSIQK